MGLPRVSYDLETKQQDNGWLWGCRVVQSLQATQIGEEGKLDRPWNIEHHLELPGLVESQAPPRIIEAELVLFHKLLRGFVCKSPK